MFRVSTLLGALLINTSVQAVTSADVIGSAEHLNHYVKWKITQSNQKLPAESTSPHLINLCKKPIKKAKLKYLD